MKTSPVLRLIIMGVLLLALHVPLTMMCGIVSERTARRDAVGSEVSGNWGGTQVVSGPVLKIPYRYPWTDQNGRVQNLTATFNLLPETLEITGDLDAAERRRAVFTVNVYTARLKIRGQFAPIDLTSFPHTYTEVLWDQAEVDVGISDPRGISRAAALTLNGQSQRCLPGAAGVGLFSTGIHASAPGITEKVGTTRFELDLELKGTRELRFVPGSQETTVQLASRWPHPSFVGLSPETPKVDRNGFAATWRIPYFGLGFPVAWRSIDPQQDQLASQAHAAAFGVALVQPVDIYVQTDRAIKYAALFIVMTFVIAFLWEITGGALVHPIQYLFVGFTMCVFYLLLLSLAEHQGFDVAYVVASAATIGLLAWYWSWVMGGRMQGALMGVALTLLYGYLYLLLRLEDYALLAGSTGLFVMLAVVMFLTRRVNWYELRLGGTPRTP
jgi:inner membrane protein